MKYCTSVLYVCNKIFLHWYTYHEFRFHVHKIWNNLWSSETVGAIRIMSSAYKIINDPPFNRHDLARSSMYIANKNGDSTEPCLTPKSSANINLHLKLNLKVVWPWPRPLFKFLRDHVWTVPGTVKFEVRSFNRFRTVSIFVGVGGLVVRVSDS